MDYERIYREFIADRKAKSKPDGYTEQHHILPRSLGGGNGIDNLIRLTASDHFFAHLLLAKIHGGSMWYAVNAMADGPLVGERAADRRFTLMRRCWYQQAKEQFSSVHSSRMKGRFTGEDHPMFGKPCSPVALAKLKERLASGLNPMHSEEVRRKVGDAHRGKVYSAETRAKIAATKIGVKLSPETRAKMSASRTGRKLSPETIEKVAAANRGKKRSPEYIEAMRQRMIGRKLSPEHAAKCAAKLRSASRFAGRSHSPETKARMSAVNQAKVRFAEMYGGDKRNVTLAMMRAKGFDI